MITVAIYLCDQSYGGPEEGGWWYRTGEPVDEFSRFTRGFRDEAKAFAYAERLNRHLCSGLNKGLPSISSVLSEGQYFAEAHDGNPRAYPETRPRYE